jgi:dipeptidyl aminopeptidase/acylaminoacyl peptidase
MRSIFIVLLVIFSEVASAATVHEQAGNIFYLGDDGTSKQLTFIHADSEPILSPDGRKVVFGRTSQVKSLIDDELEREIWLSDVSGNEEKLLMASHHDALPEKTLTRFNSWIFSTDGKHLYFLSAAWAVSDALHVLNMVSGQEHYLTEANDVLVIGKGKYANHLVVMKHKYFKGGGSYDHYWLITQAGVELKVIGEDKDDAERFIRKQR